MTLPASGAISMSQVNVELNLSSTAEISLGQTSVRTLFGVASGPISLANGWGKANTFPFTITTNVSDANLRALALAAGWNGASTPIVTINSGVYVYSTSTGTPALTINGSFPNGVQLINNGIIIGRGGNGGSGSTGTGYAGYAGGGGGVALSVAVPVSITNNGTIGGGGGGGGGGGDARTADFNSYYGYYDRPRSSPGAGGGGGRGGSTGGGGGATGASGTLTAAGAGATVYGNSVTSVGGSGGGIGSSGGTGTGWSLGGSGGAGGACTSGNSNITWLVTGTRYGALN